jgi:hypothetical protein
MPSGRMQFETFTKEQLVAALLATNTSDSIEIRDIRASNHIEECASFMTNGHKLGYLYQKDPDTNQLIKNATTGEYILRDPLVPIVPEEGIVLSSGLPHHLNWNDKDDMTTKHNTGGDIDLKRSVDASNGKNNAVFDACVLQFQFRCTTEAYVPTVSFRYIFGSEEYYEYVNSPFNDVFGFYLNGENIARIRDSDTDFDIVSINNVNYNRNIKYFYGNDPGTGA